MPNLLVQAGALSEPSNFAPLHTNRIFTGLWTNRSLLRDAATTDYQEHFGMGRQDSILGGFNSEISSKLTLRRRYGSSVFNATVIPPVKRFYSFNTFTLTDEVIRIMADTAATVYDITGGAAAVVFTKSPGAQSTYFLGVGNTLFFTNGVDNKQWVYDPTTGTGVVMNWGVAAPTIAPTVSQDPRPNPYYAWVPGTVYFITAAFTNTPFVALLDPNNNIQLIVGAPSLAATQTIVQGPPPIHGTTGTQEPNPWNATLGQTTDDGTLRWANVGPAAWQPNVVYGVGTFVAVSVNTTSGIQMVMFVNTTSGNATSGATAPHWLAGLGTLTPDANGILWLNVGIALNWANNIGPNTPFTSLGIILDPNGYTEKIVQAGKTGPSPGPNFAKLTGGQTIDGSAIWQNTGPFAVGTTSAVLYGYAAMASATVDISGMSPPSAPIVILEGNQVTVQGYGTAQGDTIVLYSTAPGGSTFMQLATFPNPGPTVQWTYVDINPGYGQNTELQAQRGGEGTPLPAGATCLGYHLTRIFAGVGNVVWVSSGPDAVVAGSSGNAGFDTQLVAQSKIIRFWACSLGMVVFTVRDAYIILGSATDADPLYMVVFIENLPLRSYDCFTVNKTTPYLMQGNNQLVSLDPSAGIIDIANPIADRLEDEYDASASYVTYHAQSSREAALYVANGSVVGGAVVPGAGQWYRMATNNAPEQGSAWSTKAQLAGLNMGCVQSVEVNPGVYRLLISGTTAGAIWQRDLTKNTDNGNKFAVQTTMGNIVLALPGQLAALSFITLESVKTGTRAGLALLLGEIFGTFETLNRTRQDPTNLPPSNTIYSDRYHFAQNQSTAWCRHFQMQISWPAEDASNELLTFTIFGQTWQEMRSQ